MFHSKEFATICNGYYLGISLTQKQIIFIYLINKFIFKIWVIDIYIFLNKHYSQNYANWIYRRFLSLLDLHIQMYLFIVYFHIKGNNKENTKKNSSTLVRQH